MDNYEQLKADNKRIKKQVEQLATYNSYLEKELEFAQAIKAQVAEFDVNGATVEKLVFKDPKGDTEHLKRALKGAVVDVIDEEGKMTAIDGLTLEEAEHYPLRNQLRLVFEDGKMFNVDNLTTIRQRLLANLPTGSEEI